MELGTWNSIRGWDGAGIGKIVDGGVGKIPWVEEVDDWAATRGIALCLEITLAKFEEVDDWAGTRLKVVSSGATVNKLLTGNWVRVGRFWGTQGRLG